MTERSQLGSGKKYRYVIAVVTLKYINISCNEHLSLLQTMTNELFPAKYKPKNIRCKAKTCL